jgi:hypothetical protein
METIRTAFLERKRTVETIVQGVLSPYQPLDYALIGAKFMGKSRVLRHLADPNGPLRGRDYEDLRPPQFKDGQRVFVMLYDCNWPDAQTPGKFMDFIVERLIRHLRRDETTTFLKWDEIEQEVKPVSKLRRIAQQIRAEGYRLVLLLDNFDTILMNNIITLEELNELRPLTHELALVVTSEQPLHDVNQKLIASPLFNVMDQLFLGLIDQEAARDWLKHYVERFHEGEELLDDLVELTGGHPYLLAHAMDILHEVSGMLPPGTTVSRQHLPLIRLRLAEHGRFVFETLAKKIDASSVANLKELVSLLIAGPISMTAVDPRLTPALNWMFNQAMVAYTDGGYRLFSPLFREYLASQMDIELPQTSAIAPALDMERFLDRLTPQESALLRYFWEHKNQVIPAETLLREVWGQPNASPRRVQEGIRRLRQRLEQASPPVGRIDNERSRGYRFVPAAESHLMEQPAI